MKKLTAILLSAVLMLTLAACSSEEENEAAKTDTDAVVETTEPVTQETTEPVTLPVTDPVGDEVFTGVTVADNKYCKIEVTGIKEDFLGKTLTVAVENKTDDMTLTFSTKACSINGVSVDTVYSEDVTAGNKSVGSVTFFDETLRENGITKYTDIEITFCVYDSENWIDDALVSETVNIYPFGKNNAELYVREPKTTDTTVFNTDKASATVTGISKDEIFGTSVDLYLENKSTDTDYTFSVAFCAVNGVEISVLGAFTVPAGKVALDCFYLSDTILEENGITDYKDIYFTLRAYDTDSWDSEDIASQSVHIYPYGEDKAVPFTREAKDTDTVIADNEQLTVIITGMSEDDIFSSHDLDFYFINKTDKEIMFTMDDVSVNGNMLDPLFATTVQPGLSKFNSASWYDDDLSENNIKSIESIEFTMVAYFAGEWDAEDIINEKITYSPATAE